MNVFSEVVKLRTEFAETSKYFSDPFNVPFEPLKQYAEFVEQKAIAFKELLRRELVNKDKNSNSSPSGPPTSAKSCTHEIALRLNILATKVESGDVDMMDISSELQLCAKLLRASA